MLYSSCPPLYQVKNLIEELLRFNKAEANRHQALVVIVVLVMVAAHDGHGTGRAYVGRINRNRPRRFANASRFTCSSLRSAGFRAGVDPYRAAAQAHSRRA